MKSILEEDWNIKNLEKFNLMAEELIEESATSKGKRTLKKLKRLTKYDQFEKRDGSIVTRAVDEEGKLVAGIEL